MAKEKAEKLAEQVRKAVESKKMSLSLRRNMRDQSSGSVEKAGDSGRHIDQYHAKQPHTANKSKRGHATAPELSQRSRTVSGVSDQNFSTQYAVIED